MFFRGFSWRPSQAGVTVLAYFDIAILTLFIIVNGLVIEGALTKIVKDSKPLGQLDTENIVFLTFVVLKFLFQLCQCIVIIVLLDGLHHKNISKCRICLTITLALIPVSTAFIVVGGIMNLINLQTTILGSCEVILRFYLLIFTYIFTRHKLQDADEIQISKF